MKILHYISDFSLPSETFIYDLINNLEENGIENHVLTHNRHLENERPFSKVKVTSEKVSFFKKVCHRLFDRWSIRNSKEVLEFLDEYQPDVIHAHFGPNGLKIYNLIQKYRLDVKLVVSFHGMDINVIPIQNTKYLKQLLKMNSVNNIYFTSPSNFLKNKMISLGLSSGKIKVIPNAYNDKFKLFQKNSFWKFGDELKLLNIGRFEEVKGQRYLLEAFALSLESYEKISLTLVGYGSLEEELRDLCNKLMIENKVTFLQKIEHSKLPNIIREHDLYIQSSIIASDGAEENLSVSTIEAQVCGLPAIVSNIGGLKEIVIDNDTGKLVEEKNVYMLSDAIIYYINNPTELKNQSFNARKKAIERFDKKSIINKTKGYYEEIQER